MKNLLNLGKALNKAQQKTIVGGHRPPSFKKVDYDCESGLCCSSDDDCPDQIIETLWGQDTLSGICNGTYCITS